MIEVNDILHSYTAGEKSVDEANAELKAIGCDFHLEPGKNALTAEEIEHTTVSDDPAQVSGYGLLDSGTATLDKVAVVHGTLQYGMGEAFALCIIGGKTFKVNGDKLEAI